MTKTIIIKQKRFTGFWRTEKSRMLSKASWNVFRQVQTRNVMKTLPEFIFPFGITTEVKSLAEINKNMFEEILLANLQPQSQFVMTLFSDYKWEPKIAYANDFLKQSNPDINLICFSIITKDFYCRDKDIIIFDKAFVFATCYPLAHYFMDIIAAINGYEEEKISKVCIGRYILEINRFGSYFEQENGIYRNLKQTAFSHLPLF
eukprot:TRINITY_DN5168_c0_g3_i9.p4 TRINITY_DN5168_c0_g3~~TRINITY_DN5168_c0_g3_i9.p4  ORF type:complete len:204 (-),score=16.94 TRINITY_DN5168_c0_g3_i9:950-1561(-)